MNSKRVYVSRELLARTILDLQHGGPHGTERVVLWLGQRLNGTFKVAELYVPGQVAAADFFHISRAEMVQLMVNLREKRTMITAQLHTHPLEAFHSIADDRWAIVRHVGALSIVLPEFGLTATVENFLTEAKIFCLNRSNQWDEVPPHLMSNHLEVA